jgi:GNAT superfamily N-acetyltransferase
MREQVMEISTATRQDIPALTELLLLLFSQEAEFHAEPALQAAGLQQIIEAPEMGRILVLRIDEAVIGMVNLLFTISTALGGRVALLEDMIVHPDWRGSGAGSKLLQAAIDLCQASGCRRVTLLTARTNQAAQTFYRRHGFTLSDMLPMRLLF